MDGLSKLNPSDSFHFRQQIVDRIFELYSPDDIHNLFLPELIGTEEIELLKSSIQLFGSWENAIYKSGLGAEVFYNFQNLYKEYWSPETITEQLRILNNYGFDLSARFIKHVYSELYSTAIKKINFGSWPSALEHAEISCKNLSTRANELWDLKRIFSVLSDYLQAYGNLQPEFIRSMNPSLYSSAHRYYPAWSKLLEAMGLSLDKNFMNYKLESFRAFITMDLLKNILEFFGSEYRMVPINPMNAPNNQSASSVDLDLKELLDVQEYYLELLEEKTKVCVVSRYRSWGYYAEREIFEYLTMYPNIICYHSIGEPREWFDDKVKFIDINQFFPELIKNGMDDIISSVSLVSRGGIPEAYQEQFNIVMKEIKKQLKAKKSSEKA